MTHFIELNIFISLYVNTNLKKYELKLNFSLSTSNYNRV